MVKFVLAINNYQGGHFVALEELWSSTPILLPKNRKLGSYACPKRPKLYKHTGTLWHFTEVLTISLRSHFFPHPILITMCVCLQKMYIRVVHACAFAHVQGCLCAYTYMCACVCLLMLACMCGCVHVRMREPLCVCVCISAHRYACTYVYVCACMWGCVHAHARKWECACAVSVPASSPPWNPSVGLACMPLGQPCTYSKLWCSCICCWTPCFRSTGCCWTMWGILSMRDTA